MANQDYQKVEDTLPPINLAKNQQDVALPAESNGKTLRTLGSFGVHQQKSIQDVSALQDIQSKEMVGVEGLGINQSKSTVQVSVESSQQKSSIEIESQNEHQNKGSQELNISSSGEKKASEIDLDTQKSSKQSASVDAIDRLNEKEKVEVAESSHDAKEEERIEFADSSQQKEEGIIKVDGVYRNKDGQAVAVFNDHIEKTASEIGMSDSHAAKKASEVEITAASSKSNEEVSVDAKSVSSKTKEEIDIDAESALKKSSTEVKPSPKSVSPKTLEGIDASVMGVSPKENENIDVKLPPFTAKTDSVIPVKPVEAGKTESEIKDTGTSMSKSDQEIDSTIRTSAKSESEIASASSIQNKSQSEINTNIAHGEKQPDEIASTSHESKRDSEIESLARSSKKGESEVDVSHIIPQKTEYSYDEILADYSQMLEEKNNSKKPTPDYSTAISTEGSADSYIENTHINFSKVPEMGKSDVTTSPFETDLNNKLNKAFNDAVPYEMPKHIFSEKELNAGIVESNAFRIDGIETSNVGSENYFISRSSLNMVEYKQSNEENVNNSFLKRETGKLANYAMEARASESAASWIGIDDGKIEGASSMHDEIIPKVLSKGIGISDYVKVGNTSAYKPAYDLTNLIPPRVGLASVLKDIVKAVVPSKYTSIPEYAPDIHNDLLRFTQRALTGEVARFVQSRLHDSVLKGYKPNASNMTSGPTDGIGQETLSASQKVFNVLNGAVSLLTANPMDLFRNKEELEYHGLIGTMGNQINRSASGIFGSMGNYYNAVRLKILAKMEGNTEVLMQSEQEIARLIKHAEDAAEREGDNYDKPRTINRDGKEETIESNKYFDDLNLRRAHNKRNKLIRNAEKLKRQYAEIIIAFDSPSEYDKYLPETETTARKEAAYSIKFKRGIEGPENEGLVDSYIVDPNATTKYNWREINLNRKPESEDDFDSAKGYLFKSDYKVLEALRIKVDAALSEQKIYFDKTARDKAIEDYFSFNFLLTEYGDNFAQVIAEATDNGNAESGKEKNTWINHVPSKLMSSVYAKSMDPSQTAYAYEMTDKDGNTVSNTDSSNPNFDDPHLISLFERQKVTSFDPRYDLYTSLFNSSDDTISKVKDSLYFLTKHPKDANSEYNYLDLSSINFDANRAYYAYNMQEYTDIQDSMTTDEKGYNRNILYQASLNYLAGKDANVDRRKTRVNMSSITDVKGDSDSPMGNNFSRNSNMHIFSWFDSGFDDDEDRSSISSMLPNADSIAINDKKNIAAYTSSDNTNVNALYKQTLGVTEFESDNVDEIIVSQKEMMSGRTVQKMNIPIAMSLVSSNESSNVKAVAIETEDGIDLKYVPEKSQNPKNEKTLTMDTIDALNRTFIIENGETVRNKKNDSYYYKIIKAKRKELDEQKLNTMKIQVAGQDFKETINLRDTNLGGLMVSSGYETDRSMPSSNFLYFEIPFQFNPEISGETRSANWNSVTAFGRTHDHFIYANTSSRNVQFKTTYAITDWIDGEAFDAMGESLKSSPDIRNDMENWAEGWTEDYVLMILNMYRSLVLPRSAYSSITPPIIVIDFGKYLGTYARANIDKYVNARWVVSEYSIDPNLDAGYSKNKTPRLYDVTLSLKEVYNGWHDLQDFYTINKHLIDWQNGKNGKEWK